ncbi:MAG: F0F1 ATP synthase subunit beta, partial [Gammaproteobacteria bacterium]|nr:F0F1 ATP synthase subunit beta [Gammaproteobacteria bacterium]
MSVTSATSTRASSRNPGRVHAVHGNVVDVRFETGLPPRFRALDAGERDRCVLEVQAHLDSHTARCIALSPTRGLRRGTEVHDRGGMLQVPVGDALLGRVIDVLGRPLDRAGPIQAQRHEAVHKAPLELSRRVPRREIFQTGIKVIDLLAPIENGGKAGLFGG